MPAYSERTIMKIRGTLVEMLIEIAPQLQKDHVSYDGNKNKTLYVSMLKQSCGMMKANMLHCEQFEKDTTDIGHTLNPYEPCVANKIIEKINML